MSDDESLLMPRADAEGVVAALEAGARLMLLLAGRAPTMALAAEAVVLAAKAAELAARWQDAIASARTDDEPDP